MRLPAQLIFVGYFLGLAGWFGWHSLQGGSYLAWTTWEPVVSWLVGGFIGYWLLSLDRFVDVYLTHPETQLSHYVRYYIQKGNYRWAWTTLEQRKAEQTRLTFHNAVFQAIWVILAVFAVTSSPGLLGKGVVMGLGLHLLLNEWRDYIESPDRLRRWLFWQVQREITLKEQKLFLWGVTGITALLTLFLF
jgi:hypothetical protein